MKKWLALYRKQGWDKRVLIGAALLALIPVLITTLRPAPPAADPGEPALAVDTHIPRGFVLVPIEAANYESLDSILGQFGWVDLYQAGGETTDRRLVASNLRLLRAPRNPSQFAVLVPHRESARLLKAGGVFTVVVRRPGRSGTEFVESPRTAVARRRIIYDGE